MSIFTARIDVRIVLTALIAAGAGHVWADSPAVTAVLNSSEAVVGQVVQMDVKISGATNVNAPDDIQADGLEIHRTGERYESQLSLGFGGNKNSSSVIYTYTVLPQKPGTFKIPPQNIRAGGTLLHTPELTLHVSNTQNRQVAPNSRSGQSIDPSKLVTAELIVPKQSAYVGEMIPVVVRIAAAARLVALEPPTITGQGFTIQKMQSGDQPKIEVINGRQTEVYTFKTAIAAVRPGKLEIGPVKANAKVVVPTTRSRGSRSRSPFDIFNMDDPFSDPFFSDPFGRSGERREVPVLSQPAALEVKALPANPPQNFGGAVGTFTMTVAANPKSVQTGDPITVTSTITGRGNFDRLSAPAMEDEQGWHNYPPTSKFQQDDDVGISGTKTFEMVLSPNEKKDVIAPFAFSYFDPAKEDYVTLRSEAIPIRVQGAALAASAAPSATATIQTTPKPPAAASPQTTPKRADILYQLTERPRRPQSFAPIYARRTFWLIQLSALLVFAAFTIWNLRRSVRVDARVQRAAALQQEAAQLMRQLRHDDGSAQEYFSRASRAVQLKTALARDIEPTEVDAETAAAAFRVDERARAKLRELFQRSDELRYSGGHNGGISAESRSEVLELVESLRS